MLTAACHVFNDEHVFNGAKGIAFLERWLEGKG